MGVDRTLNNFLKTLLLDYVVCRGLLRGGKILTSDVMQTMAPESNQLTTQKQKTALLHVHNFSFCGARRMAVRPDFVGITENKILQITRSCRKTYGLHEYLPTLHNTYSFAYSVGRSYCRKQPCEG